MKRITFHEDADAELIESARYYEERARGLGHSFLAVVKTAADLIQANPEAFPLIGNEVRQKLLYRFPYSLLYVIESDRIRILAVAHEKRRPGYWFYRLFL